MGHELPIIEKGKGSKGQRGILLVWICMDRNTVFLAFAISSNFIRQNEFLSFTGSKSAESHIL